MGSTTTKKIGKNVPTSVPSSSKLTRNCILLCSADPPHFVSPSVSALEELAIQRKPRMRLNFSEKETALNKKLFGVLEKLN